VIPALSVIEGLLVFLLVMPASADKWAHDLTGVRVAALESVRKNPPKARTVRKKAIEPLSRVAETVQWESLLTRATTRPTKVQTTKVGDTTYSFSGFCV